MQSFVIGMHTAYPLELCFMVKTVFSDQIGQDADRMHWADFFERREPLGMIYIKFISTGMHHILSEKIALLGPGDKNWPYNVDTITCALLNRRDAMDTSLLYMNQATLNILHKFLKLARSIPVERKGFLTEWRWPNKISTWGHFLWGSRKCNRISIYAEKKYPKFPPPGSWALWRIKFHYQDE